MKRYRVLLASILMQGCLGGIYAWTMLAVPLSEKYGLDAARAAFIFGAAIATFSLAMVFAGRIQESRGPRLTASIGALLYGLGHLVASASGGNFTLLLTGYSIIAGTGIGFCYVCPLATCVRWFPERKGLVTGLAVGGFGIGALGLTRGVVHLLALEMDVLEILRGIGLVYGAVLLVCAAQLAWPPRDPRAERWTGRFDFGLVMRRRDFWSLVTGMFTGTFAGLLVIGNLKPMALGQGLNVTDAALAVSLFAVGNASGRIIWGMIHDRLGRLAIILSLMLMAAAIALLGLSGAGGGFTISAGLVGFAFGGAMVLYAVELVAVHGQESMGRIYPLIFLSYGASGILGPAIGGWLNDRFGSYFPALWLAGLVAGLGVFFFIRLSAPTTRPTRKTPLTPSLR